MTVDFVKMAKGFAKTAEERGMFVGRWIPVSERLPEVNQRVLVTSYGRVCYAMMISADGNSGYPVFKLQDSLNEKVVCETTVHSKFTTGRIKAWMPLPAPYEPQGKRCADCNHYGKLSLDCGRCDDDCSMFEPQEREDKE